MTKHANAVDGEPLLLALTRRGYTIPTLAAALGCTIPLVEKWTSGAVRLPRKREEQLRALFALGQIDEEGLTPGRLRAPRRHRPAVNACAGCDGDPAAYEALVGEPCCACRGTGSRPEGRA